jgi:hypothetical protein
MLVIFVHNRSPRSNLIPPLLWTSCTKLENLQSCTRICVLWVHVHVHVYVCYGYRICP